VSAFARASSSLRVAARTAIGNSGSGISHGRMTSGVCWEEIVSPVSALASRAITHHTISGQTR